MRRQSLTNIDPGRMGFALLVFYLYQCYTGRRRHRRCRRRRHHHHHHHHHQRQQHQQHLFLYHFFIIFVFLPLLLGSLTLNHIQGQMKSLFCISANV